MGDVIQGLLESGYDASLPVDEFLTMIFIPCCWLCGVHIEAGMESVMILRVGKERWARVMGPMIHAKHILLVDLVV